MGKESEPLKGKTIVVTRPRNQAGEFSRRLMELGAEVVEFPTIRIIPPKSWKALDEAIDNIHRYDWVVFTSANGVSSFAARLKKAGVNPLELRGISFCAIGPRTARQLERKSMEVHLVPEEYRAEAVVESLSREGIRGKRVLLARAARAREVLPEQLRNRGAMVDVVAAYRTVLPAADTSRLLERLEQGRIDAVTFTSPSTVSNFVEIFSASRERLFRGLRGVVIGTIGPITRRRALELGIQVQVSPVEYTTQALAQAMAEYFLLHGSGKAAEEGPTAGDQVPAGTAGTGRG
ncbi:MAG: uroporphyrinogen-III synthase [Deltaproteobacteria bacterium]|nr:uroporphyrinogen-III synthase [Deltaproteobacteria bacterium]